MKINEFYLKTAFCCIAYEGNITPKDVAFLKEYTIKSKVFTDLKIENKLNKYITSISKQGALFLKNYIAEMNKADLSEIEQLEIIQIAIDTITTDNKINYSKISFFKKIRSCLNISDKMILKEIPDIKEYLLPDINQDDDFILEAPSTTKLNIKKY